VAAAVDHEIVRFVHQRALPALRHGQFGQGRRQVQLGHETRGLGDCFGPSDQLAHQVVEHPQFDRQGLVGGAGDLALQLGQLDGRVAYGAGQGLAVDEGRLGA
jgi:hypothetical protein